MTSIINYGMKFLGQLPKFNGAIEDWEWISNFMVYQAGDYLFMLRLKLVKGATG